MLEIFVLFAIVRSLRNRAAARGASEWWAALGPLLWVGGELAIFFVAGAAGADDLTPYPFALAYAAFGAWLAHYIIDRVPVGSVAVPEGA